VVIGAATAQRRFAEALLVAALVAIAGLTLGPAEGSGAAAGSRIVVLGSLADVLRNVALYLPFGSALALRGVGSRFTWLLGFVLAGGIEIAQLGIPGRASSPDDVLANALGAGPAPAWVRRCERLALGVWLACVLASAVLSVPALTPGPWYAHWNPALGTLVPYAGPVREATLAGQALAHGTLRDAPAAREALAAGEPLRVQLVSTGPSSEFEGIFMLSDAADRELALFAIEGEDLVYRIRSRARVLGLEPAVLRVSGAWRGAGAGAPVALGLWRADAAWCLARDASVRCGLGFSAGSGWTLLLPVLEFPPDLAPLLDALFLAGLALPLGLWWRGGVASWLVLALAVAPLVLLPAFGWLLPTGVSLWGGAAGGWLVGRLLAGSLAPSSRAPKRSAA
jgi:hypothetical protein